MKTKIGFMQGRLSPLENGKIQSFPWNNWEKEFEIGKKLKFNILEWTLDYDGLYFNPLMTNIGQKRIKQLIKKYNFNITSLTGDCFMQKPFWKLKKDRKRLQQDFLNIVARCIKLGIKKVVLPLVDNGRIENKKQELMLVNFLKNIKLFLKKNKVQILFESDFPPKKYINFIKKFDTSFIGINYDTGNSASKGFDPSEEIETYGKYIKNVHIKDRLFRGKTVPLGTGNADFKSIFKNLSKIKYNGNYILQTARSTKNQHDKVLLQYKNYILNFVKKNV